MADPVATAGHFLLDLFDFEGVEPSPDGRRVVVSGRRPAVAAASVDAAGVKHAGGAGPQTYVVDIETGAAELVATPGRVTAVTWADDRTLAFGVDRGVALVELRSGRIELRPVGGQVVDVRPDASGTALAVLHSLEPADAPGWPEPGLGSSPAATGASAVSILLVADRRVVAGLELAVRAWEFDVAGAEPARVAVIGSADSSDEGWYSSRLSVHDLDGSVRVLTGPGRQVTCPSFAADATSIFYIEGYTTNYGLGRGAVFETRIVDGQVTPIDVGDVDVTWIGRGPQQRLYFAGWRDTTAALGFRSATGELHEIPLDGRRIGRRHAATAAVRPSSPAVCAVIGGGSGAPEIQVHGAGGAGGAVWRQVTTLNADARPGAVDRRRIRWASSDGLMITGELLGPAGRAEAALPLPLPLVVVVHGGPTGLWSNAFVHLSAGVPFAELLVHNGYRVLLPNPRGSSGRGEQFARALVGDVGGREVDDVLTGVDWCVEHGAGDRERLGIMGASWGGFLTAMTVTRSDRFSAAVVVSGIADWRLIASGARAGRGSCELLFGGSADDLDTDYRRASPLSYTDSWSTPVLFLHGAQDVDVPAAQSELLHRALIARGVETDRIVYPREGHRIDQPAHRLDAADRVVKWFGARLTR